MALAANALTTLASVKTIAGITDTSQDTRLEFLINAVSSTIEGYLDRKLQLDAAHPYIENIAPTSRQKLILRQWPIVGVSSLKSSGTTLILDTDYRLDAQDKWGGWIYREQGWEPVNLTAGLTYDIMAARRTIEVTYTAGYLLPNDTGYTVGADGSLPLEISQVCIEMVIAKNSKSLTGGYGFDNVKQGGLSYTYTNPSGSGTSGGSRFMGIEDQYAMVLNQFRRFYVA